MNSTHVTARSSPHLDGRFYKMNLALFANNKMKSCWLVKNNAAVRKPLHGQFALQPIHDEHASAIADRSKRKVLAIRTEIQVRLIEADARFIEVTSRRRDGSIRSVLHS